MAARLRPRDTRRPLLRRKSQTGNETVRPAPGHEPLETRRPPHTAGETGAFLKYSIGQQRAQSMSQSAAKAKPKWPTDPLGASSRSSVLTPEARAGSF